MKSDWIEIKKAKIKCPICDKPDWCGISDDGEAVICMRVSSGHPTNNGGWLHRLTDPRPVYVPPPARIRTCPNLETLWRRWEQSTDHHLIDGLAMGLSVDADALQSIGCAWNGEAWAFPMKDAQSKMIGIRLRGTDGHKWAVTGSRQGLFIPRQTSDDTTIYLTEGPTDLAAALTLGLRAIGRASCVGQEQMIIEYLQRAGARRLVVVTDNDTPGMNGALKLQAMLPIRSCVFVPPTKDIREYAIRGGTAALLEQSVNSMVWRRA